MDRKTLGQHGENAAAQFLMRAGCTILDRNWRTEQGEIDLIAREGDQLLFVEVRTRASSQFGSPEESITPSKAQKIMLAAQDYLVTHADSELNWRIDVIAIDCDPSGTVIRLDHYQNALADYLDMPE
jgi:putative endonuclease